MGSMPATRASVAPGQRYFPLKYSDPKYLTSRSASISFLLSRAMVRACIPFLLSFFVTFVAAKLLRCAARQLYCVSPFDVAIRAYMRRARMEHLTRIRRALFLPTIVYRDHDPSRPSLW